MEKNNTQTTLRKISRISKSPIKKEEKKKKSEKAFNKQVLSLTMHITTINVNYIIHIFAHINILNPLVLYSIKLLGFFK